MGDSLRESPTITDNSTPLSAAAALVRVALTRYAKSLQLPRVVAQMQGRNRKLRVRLLLGLVALGGLGVYAFQSSKNQDRAAADRALAHRDFQTAGDHLDRYLSTHAGDGSARLLAAQIARRSGNYAAAADHLRQCSQEPGQSPAVELERRLLAAQQGDLREIGSLMQEYGKGSRTPETALVAEAVAVGILGKLPPPGADPNIPPAAAPFVAVARQAADLWLELRTEPKDRAAGMVWRGHLAALGGDHAGAVAGLRRALELDPDSFDARFYLALAVLQTDPAQTAEHLAALRNRRPNDPRVRYALASCYRALGRLDAAAKLLDEALAANPNDVSALVERGNAALDLGRTGEAEQFLTRALQIAPNAAPVHLGLSRCFQLSGRPEKAKEHHDRFLQLTPPKPAGQSPP